MLVLLVGVKLKGLEADSNLDLIVWVDNTRVGLNATSLGSCGLDLEADLLLKSARVIN